MLNTPDGRRLADEVADARLTPPIIQAGVLACALDGLYCIGSGFT